MERLTFCSVLLNNRRERDYYYCYCCSCNLLLSILLLPYERSHNYIIVNEFLILRDTTGARMRVLGDSRKFRGTMVQGRALHPSLQQVCLFIIHKSQVFKVETHNKCLERERERERERDEMKCLCFRPLFCTMKAELGRGQLGLMR